MATGATTGMDSNYNSNSVPQLAALVGSEHYIQCAIDALDLRPSSLVMIADFGSSLGFNSLQAIKIIFQCLHETKKIDDQSTPLVIFNDLPTNNWTSLFQLVAQESWCYGLASGRSFYEQCLPSNSLSVGYSSSAVHWLSCKPSNLSKHCCYAFVEPGEERYAFQAQGHRDYDAFLQHRAQEFHLGGVLILAHCCVNDQGSTGSDQALHLAYKCAESYLTPQELLEFNYPCYFRSYAECIDPDLLARHSFKLIKAGFARVDSPLYAKYRDGQLTLDGFAQAKTRWIRSWSESSLEQALKTNGLRSDENVEQVLNQIWTHYEQEVRGRPDEYNDCTFCTYMVLKKV